MLRKRICVITDNKYIYEKFKEIKDKYPHDFVFYYSAHNNKFIDEYANDIDFSPISLKSRDETFYQQFDLFISLHCKQLFPKILVDNHNCINVHPGFNPYNRGWFPQVFSIINGKPIGVTIHKMDEELDHGAIIAQKKLEIEPWETSLDIYRRILQAEYGNICNVDEIQRLANKYGLKVIYDAAHTFGEVYRGHSVADYGDASCLSFHATKVFNTIEGGAVVYHSEELGRRIYNLKNFGIHGPERVEAVGANAKMNEFAAAMGLCNLRHLEEEIEKRRKVVERYRERLSGIDGLRLCPVQKDLKQNYAYFPVVFEEKLFGASRNEVYEALAKQDILARKYFYPLVNSFACFHGKYDPADTPVAQHVANRVLTLPLYADLALEIVDKICDIVLGLKK